MLFKNCRDEGASWDQLSICRKTPGSEYVSRKTLNMECPYTWKSVFSGYFHCLSTVMLPLELPPCQVKEMNNYALLVFSSSSSWLQVAAEVKNTKNRIIYIYNCVL